jgi:pyruvate/2-oxoglutarate dehydrogenase complex dihydrolipoamide dehydrogenase (E3) component
MAQTYDAIVIGTGQARPTLAGAGKRVATVERHRFGGTCVNVGCIPTKALVASTRAAHVARRAADYGVVINSEIRVDMARVRARKDEIVRHSNEGIERGLKGLDNCTLLEGHGRFEMPHQVRVDDQLVEAEQIFVNVGARTYIPPLPGLDQVDYLTNFGIMRLDTLPDHLVIIGGGYIGLEFAQMYRRFGSQVTLIEMDNRLIRRKSEDVSLAVQEILEAEGVAVRLNAECRAVEKGETQGFMKVLVDAETEQILCAAILGVGGDEVIHCLLDTMYAKASFSERSTSTRRSRS